MAKMPGRDEIGRNQGIGEGAASDGAAEGDAERADREAIGWLLALQEDPRDAALRAEFDRWLDAGPANGAAWAEAAHVYRRIGETEPAHAASWSPAVDPAEAVPAPPFRHAGPPPVGIGRRRGRARETGRLGTRRVLPRLAAIAAVAILAVLAGPELMLRWQADYVTATGERRTLQLEDGSIVQLAPGSAIDIAFTGPLRRVRLLRGEAFFEVAPDPRRPFKVDARQLETTVLGTGFNVSLGGMAAEVAVSHGLVRVEHDFAQAPPQISRQLQAGDWVRIEDDGQLAAGRKPPEQAAAWLQGQIVARDRSVADIVEQLRRYYPGFIILADDRLGRQRLTGVYNLADPVAALDAVVQAHGGHISHIGRWGMVLVAG